MQDFWFKHADNETYMVQKYIGDDASVTVPSSYYGCEVSVLMDDIFKGHTEISEVILPETLRDIGGFVFDGCTSLKTIRLPSSLSALWQYAFVRSSFEELVIPEKVTIIPPFCFQDCHELKKVTFLSGQIRLMSSCFLNCYSLEEVCLPSQIQIHPLAFKNCGNVRIVQKP